MVFRFSLGIGSGEGGDPASNTRVSSPGSASVGSSICADSAVASATRAYSQALPPRYVVGKQTAVKEIAKLSTEQFEQTYRTNVYAMFWLCKAAITGFTHTLAKPVIEQGIRVNGVAPGPVWTPLQTSGGQSQEKIPDLGGERAHESSRSAGGTCGCHLVLAGANRLAQTSGEFCAEKKDLGGVAQP